MKEESTGCICPPQIPVCRCGHKATLRIISKKVIVPSIAEVESNPRSRSAKMRVAERIA
jgi:16S rRNA (cytosine1402-N4)-methyltransferase